MSTVPANAVDIENAAQGEADDGAHTDVLAGTRGFMWTFRACLFGCLLVVAWQGGPLARTAAVFGMILAIVGDRAGAVCHLIALASIPVILILVDKVGLPLGGWMARWIDIPGPMALAIGVLLVMVAGVGAIGAVSRRFGTLFQSRRYLYVLNRTAGGVLGVLEGALIAIVIYWILGVFGTSIGLHAEQISKTHPKFARAMGMIDSFRGALMSDPNGRPLDAMNPLPRSPVVMTVAALSELSAEPGTFWRIVEEGELDQLLNDPRIRAHFESAKNDPAFMDAIERRDLRALLESPHLAAALNDDYLCRKVAERWPKVRNHIALEDLEKVRHLAESLDGEARAKYERALKRAEEFGVELRSGGE